MNDHDDIEAITRKLRKAGLPTNPWLKIVRAAARGTGVRLTAREVRRLSYDDAIETAAFQTAHQDLGEDPYR